MSKVYLIILFFVYCIGNVTAQTIDQKLSLLNNSKQIGGEFVIGYQVKGTNLTSAITLASINVDIIYDTTTLKFTGGTDWLPALSESNGYLKCIKSNSAEFGQYQSIRIIITAPYLNDSGSSNSSGFDISNQYSLIVKIHFNILVDTGYTRVSIKSVTNQAGLFMNPHNQPNTFDVMSMTLSAPVIINEPLPVNLTSFSSEVTKNDVKLIWKTNNEINNQGFEIQRQYSATGHQYSDWDMIGFVKGNGTTNNLTNYTFEDKKINSGKYKYRLKQIDYNGNFSYYNLQNNIEIGIPDKFSLSQNYPNPFNPVTKIDYEISADSRVKISIFDIAGKVLQTLLNEQVSAGYHTLKFNGDNLSSGVYFYRIICESQSLKFIDTKKMVLLK